MGDFRDEFSPWAQVSQQPPGFEFPRRELPAHFHFCGPFLDPFARPSTPFPFEALDGRPLIYASLGTIQNRRAWIYRAIAQACAGNGFQLVLSLGGWDGREALGPLPGDPIVVRYAPQVELLARASLAIAHAGLDSTLEALSLGVPQVVIPLSYEQPGVAASIGWIGAGLVVPPDS